MTELRLLVRLLEKQVARCEQSSKELRLYEDRIEARGRARAYRHVLRTLKPLARTS